VADARTLAVLEELERADSDVSATLAELESLAAEVEKVRLRALELGSFLARLPDERERLAAASAEAARRVEAARAELAAAERELAAAEEREDREDVSAARNAVVRARDALRMAERRASEAESELRGLESEAQAAREEASELVERAARLADELKNRPRLPRSAGELPGRDLSSVSEWASTARAALFVAKGSVAAERDAIVRQASELGSVVLREPVFAASVAEVVRRIRDAD
jgi:chromosome segregation ATPase